MNMLSIDVTFDAAHRLWGYKGRCSAVHGHLYQVKVSVTSDELNDQGFVIDFGDIKKIVKMYIDDEWDHTLILNKLDPIYKLLEDQDIRMYILDKNPTVEYMSMIIYNRLKELLPKTVQMKQITIWETPTCSYTYSESEETV
jgi:6-pyruvoyltetrahydropterin/6-carboxytetrahydropterin synthase